jgi:hypothetical protein
LNVNDDPIWRKIWQVPLLLLVELAGPMHLTISVPYFFIR